jgi:hypothetical protein
MRIMATCPRAAEGEAHGHRGARGRARDEHRVELAVVDLDRLSGVRDLDRTAARCSSTLKSAGIRAAAGEHHARDAVVGGRRRRSRASAGSAHELVGDALDDPLHLLRHHRVGIALATDLERLRLLVGNVELLLDLLGEGVAAHGDVAGEGRGAAGEDVDVRHRRADVDEHDRLAGRQLVVHLVSVLDREGVHVDHRGGEARLGAHRRVVVDHVLLGRDEEDVHLPRGVAARRQDLRVYVDVLDVERDVLLRLPLDGVVELLLRHARERDLLDDDGVAADADGHLLRLQLLPGDELLDGLHHRPRVHERAVDDRLRGEPGGAERLQR